jgi:hypothetical protein
VISPPIFSKTFRDSPGDVGPTAGRWLYSHILAACSSIGSISKPGEKTASQPPPQEGPPVLSEPLMEEVFVRSYSSVVFVRRIRPS